MLSACQRAAVAGGERECLQSLGKEMRFQFPGLGTYHCPIRETLLCRGFPLILSSALTINLKYLNNLSV